jgi:predicted phosphodiesterase
VDVGGEGVLDLLAGLPVAFVWGNTDWDRMGLERYARDLGLQCFGNFGEVELGGKSIAITHGDDLRVVRGVIDASGMTICCSATRTSGPTSVPVGSG